MAIIPYRTLAQTLRCCFMKNYYENYWLGTLDKENTLFADPPYWPEKESNRILDAMKGRIEGRVLDIGCGDGCFGRKLLERQKGLELHGVDIAETAIRKAHKVANAKMRLAVCDVVSLPYQNNSFDCVLMLEVIEHVFDIINFLSEIYRVLKKDGVLFITTTDFNFLKKVIISCFFFDRYFYPTNPHIRFFTRKNLRSVLIKCGFEVIHQQWNGDYFRLMPMGQIMVGKKITHKI